MRWSLRYMWDTEVARLRAIQFPNLTIAELEPTTRSD
jgi:hypothetical protein